MTPPTLGLDVDIKHTHLRILVSDRARLVEETCHSWLSYKAETRHRPIFLCVLCKFCYPKVQCIPIFFCLPEPGMVPECTDGRDIAVVTSALKSFFHMLAEPLIPTSIYSGLVEIVGKVAID